MTAPDCLLHRGVVAFARKSWWRARCNIWLGSGWRGASRRSGCPGTRATRGATLVRPGLEALRDLAAQGCLDVVLCYSPDRLARKFACQALLLEEFARGGHDECPGLAVGLGPFGAGAALGDRQPDRLHGTVASFGRAAGLAGLGGPGGADRVERVGLALAAAVLPVGAVDLDDADAGGGDVAGQAGAVAAGARCLIAAGGGCSRGAGCSGLGEPGWRARRPGRRRIRGRRPSRCRPSRWRPPGRSRRRSRW
jgi:hypothetical protein